MDISTVTLVSRFFRSISEKQTYTRLEIVPAKPALKQKLRLTWPKGTSIWRLLTRRAFTSSTTFYSDDINCRQIALTYIRQRLVIPERLNGIATFPDHELSTESLEVPVHILQVTSSNSHRLFALEVKFTLALHWIRDSVTNRKYTDFTFIQRGRGRFKFLGQTQSVLGELKFECRVRGSIEPF